MRELWEDVSFALRFYPLEMALAFFVGSLFSSLMILSAVFVPLDWII